MDAKKPNNTEVDALMAQVAEQREEVRKLREELERIVARIEELRLQRPGVRPTSD